MISPEVEVDAQRAMRGMLLLFLVLAVCVHVECRAPTARCRHKVRTPSKCHDQGSCSLYARLTPAENSTLFYCCHSGYKSSNNECVDIDECALDPKPCEETCTNHPGSYACGCHEGFHMNDATGKCVKTTECLNLNCSNSCFYEANGPVCDCPRGFTLQGAKNCTLDKKVCPTNYHIEFESNTCRVMGDDPQMLFAFDGQIYEYSLRQESNLKKLVKVDQNVNAMYYDSGAKVAYFAGQVLTAVNFSSSQPVASRQSLPREAISMAFDYVHKRIYVLDDTSLGLWSMEGGLTSLGTLIDHDGSITQVAVDPGNSWLLYTSKGHVIKARLNGQKFGEVFDFYVHVRNEDVKTEVLAVDDTDNNELFFYYGVNRNIFTFDVAGRHLLWVTEDTPGNIIYMDVFEDFIYYSMQGVDGLTARTKDGLKAPIVYFSGQIVHAHYVNHPARQQESTHWQCSKKCAQLCFRDTSDISRCACTQDYTLGQDKISCNHVNASAPISQLGTPSPQIDAFDESESLAVTSTSSPHNGFLLVGCVLLLSVCVVQSLLMWWFYPRRRFQPNMGVLFNARFGDSGSRVALDSVRDSVSEN